MSKPVLSIISTLGGLFFTIFLCKAFVLLNLRWFNQRGKKRLRVKSYSFSGGFCASYRPLGCFICAGLSEVEQKCYSKKMDRKLYDATEIKDLNKKWTVLVQVIERRKPRKSEGGPLYRNYMVTDMKGTKVPLVAFDKNVASFANTLFPFKRYKVSNAIVKETPPAYKVVDYEYTWTLHKRVLVEPYHDDVPHPLPCTFAYDKFSDFYRYAD